MDSPDTTSISPQSIVGPGAAVHKNRKDSPPRELHSANARIETLTGRVRYVFFLDFGKFAYIYNHPKHSCGQVVTYTVTILK